MWVRTIRVCQGANLHRQFKYCSFPCPHSARHGCQPHHLEHRLQKSPVLQNIPWKSQFFPCAMTNGAICSRISWCLEHRLKLHCPPVFCSLYTHVKAKEATPLKGFCWQPVGRQVVEVMKGATCHFASSTWKCRPSSNCKWSRHKYNLTFPWR